MSLHHALRYPRTSHRWSTAMIYHTDIVHLFRSDRAVDTVRESSLDRSGSGENWVPQNKPEPVSANLVIASTDCGHRCRIVVEASAMAGKSG